MKPHARAHASDIFAILTPIGITRIPSPRTHHHVKEHWIFWGGFKVAADETLAGLPCARDVSTKARSQYTIAVFRVPATILIAYKRTSNTVSKHADASQRARAHFEHAIVSTGAGERGGYVQVKANARGRFCFGLEIHK